MDKLKIFFDTLKKIYFLIFHYKIFQDTIRLESTTLCQLRCIGCHRTQKDGDILIGKGYLKFNDFKYFVDTNPSIKYIELSNYGEMFLNPDLLKIIIYAYKKNIRLTACNGVNLNTVSEKILEALVKYQFYGFSVSIDGASDETYRIFRINGNFNTVIENIKTINFYKKKYNSKYPILGWQFILFGHNEHELPTAKEMAKKLNMLFIIAENGLPDYSPIKNKEFINTFTTLFTDKSIFIKSLPCYQLWFSPQINWDGKLLGCCANRRSDFGNIFKSDFKQCITSERYVYAKKMLLGKERERADIPCSNCIFYKKIIDSKDLFRKIKKILLKNKWIAAWYMLTNTSHRVLYPKV